MGAKRLWLIAAVIAFFSHSLHAEGTAEFVAWNGTQVNIASGEFGDILQNADNAFSFQDIQRVDQELQSQGIATQDRINIFLTQTAAGLSVVTLLGGLESPEDPGQPTAVSATTFVPGSANWHYNVDSGGTFDAVPLGDTTLLNGLFQWNTGENFAAMATSNLAFGDSGTLQLNLFQQGGLSTNNTIQVLTSQGGVWSVVEQFDFETSEDGGPDYQYFEFAITDIPAPGGLFIILLAYGMDRRRRH